MPVLVPDDQTGNDVHDILKQHFEIHDLGDAKKVLGMEIHQNEETGFAKLTQSGYIDKLLQKFEMSKSKTVSTPFPHNLKLNTTDGNNLENVTIYRELVSSLIHAMNYTHPDIAYPVLVLARYMQCLKTLHWKAAKHVLRYLKELNQWELSSLENESCLVS